MHHVTSSGEPGIGKSRIAQTVLERLSGEPYTRLRYFCSPHHQDSALYPSIAQLERAAAFRREDTDEQRLDKLESVLALGTNDLGEAVPLLAALLSIPTPARYPQLNFSPQKQKEKILKALLAQLEGHAARQPVILVVEDAHWSDPSSRELFDLTIDRILTLPVLVIITFRPEFAPSWVGRSHVTLLSLNRLAPRQRAEMIARVTGGKALPKEIVGQIVDRTDGVPLFIEELTKAVIESGALTDAGDRYTLAGPLPLLAIPTSLNASLLARLDRLTQVREVAQIGAALGRQFSHELISAVAPMPQHQLDDALAQLVSTELIFRRGTPPNAEYTFKHALVQDAAYSTLLRNRRQQLHARIAIMLEGQFPEIVTGQPALLAHHCAEAGLIEKAIGYRRKAGQQAIARSAMMEAETQLREGLGLLVHLPEGPERKKKELSLQMTLALALFATKGWTAPSAGETLARARQLCADFDRPHQLAQVLTGQFVYRLNRAELTLACRLSKDLLELGAARDDAVIKFTGYACSAQTWFFLGEFSAARADAEQALGLYDPTYLILWTTDPQIIALIFSFQSLMYLGYLDQARLQRDKALARARQRTHAATLASLLVSTMLCEADIQSDPAILLQQAEKLEALCAEHGFAYYTAVATSLRGWCLTDLGRTEEGLALQTEALAAYHGIRTLLGLPAWLTRLADAYTKAGRVKEGLKQLDEAARQIEATQERWAEAEMHRLRGTLLLSMDEHPAAEDSYRQALAVARRQNAKFWELRAALDLGRLWRDQGKRTEARDLLAPVYNWFTEGFDTPILKDAKAVLDELA